MFQGWTFPVPDDDMVSCDGLGSPISKLSNEDFSDFVDADQPRAVQSPPQTVCRAVPGSEQQRGFSATMSAGDIALQTADTNTGELNTTIEREHSIMGSPEQTLLSFEQRRQHQISSSTPDPRATDGLNY